MRRAASLFAFVLFTGSMLAGQSPAQPQAANPAAPAFEAASVKPNTSGTPGSTMRTPPRGLMTATNMSLRMLIVNAYRIQSFQLLGGPGWIESERFDITAKTPDDAAGDQVPLMLQTLLAERFKLRVHRETREQPIYALVLARTDGRLGPQLTRSTADCAAIDAARRAGTAPPAPLAGRGQRPQCSGRMFMSDARGEISLGGRELSQLLPTLAGMLNRPVVDRTGLTGLFDLDLTWSSDPGAAPRPGDTVPTADSPSIFTALQEQLGLKLESTRGPVELVVIDSVERPGPD